MEVQDLRGGADIWCGKSDIPHTGAQWPRSRTPTLCMVSESWSWCRRWSAPRVLRTKAQELCEGAAYKNERVRTTSISCRLAIVKWTSTKFQLRFSTHVPLSETGPIKISKGVLIYYSLKLSSEERHSDLATGWPKCTGLFVSYLTNPTCYLRTFSPWVLTILGHPLWFEGPEADP